MPRSFSLVLTASFAGLFATAILACSDSARRPPLDDTPDATPGPDGGLPDASPPVEAGADARPPFDPADVPVTCTEEPCAVELAAGTAHVCARMSDGSARCWGDGMLGALGGGEPDGGEEPGPGPTTVVGLAGAVTQLSAAGRTTCARLAGGEAYCWGANEEGQLGLAIDPYVVDDLPHPTPAPVALPGPATRVDAGPRGGCALLVSGAVWCWGANDRLQLGRFTDDLVAGPGELPAGGLPATRLGLGRRSSFALTGLGALVGWGSVSGRDGSLDPDPVPFELPALRDVTGFAAGPDHTCAIAGASMSCWGRNRRGALCSGLPDDERLPARAAPAGPAASLAHPQRLAASAQTTCVRMTDGSIQCCGDDTFGQLGTGKVTGKSSALVEAKAFGREAVQVVVTDDATCALVRDGTVECWGGNAHGELGEGTKDDAPHPTPVRVGL